MVAPLLLGEQWLKRKLELEKLRVRTVAYEYFSSIKSKIKSNENSIEKRIKQTSAEGRFLHRFKKNICYYLLVSDSL